MTREAKIESLYNLSTEMADVLREAYLTRLKLMSEERLDREYKKYVLKEI